MRGVLLLLLASCNVSGSDRTGDDDGSVVPVGPSGRCTTDDQCSSGQVCARTSRCYATSQIHAVHVTWTVDGLPASATTCGTAADLEIYFRGDQSRDDSIGFLPVPCVAGKFSIDKLPISYTQVQLGGGDVAWQSGILDEDTGEATLDLQL